MNIVIIEDELLTINNLIKTIKNIDPKINILTSLFSVEDAIDWFKKNEQPDLIFSDIQLGDGICFDIFNSMDNMAPIVFCTAYDEYAIDAFKTNGIDYILKPFDSESIEKALNKYNKLASSFIQHENHIKDLIKCFDNKQSQLRSSVLVYYKDKILPVRISDVAIFYIENEITQLITLDQKKYAIDKSLDEIEKIAGEKFFRANRQCVVQRKSIKEVSQFFGRSLSIKLIIPFNEIIKVNKVKVTFFLNWLSSF